MMWPPFTYIGTAGLLINFLRAAAQTIANTFEYKLFLVSRRESDTSTTFYYLAQRIGACTVLNDDEYSE